jgi:D-sedoheptulose 7-phosphate isomerase
MNFTQYIQQVNTTLDSVSENEIEDFINFLLDAYYNDKFIFIIGNGGSAANASHLAQDLAKGTRLTENQEKRIKAISLTDNISFITAQGNDEGYESIFVQQLRSFARPGDYLVAISGSGNSPNIIKAVEWANNKGVKTIGITGFDGGKLRKIANHSVHVNLNEMCTAESIHSVIFHYIVLELRIRMKT